MPCWLFHYYPYDTEIIGQVKRHNQKIHVGATVVSRAESEPPVRAPGLAKPEWVRWCSIVEALRGEERPICPSESGQSLLLGEGNVRCQSRGQDRRREFTTTRAWREQFSLEECRGATRSFTIV
jgi:hypothetical protein